MFIPQFLIAQADTFGHAVRRLEWKYNNTNYSSLQIGRYTVAPNQYMGKTAGNTGLCINPLTNQIITSLYNYNQASIVYIFNRSALTPYSGAGTITPVPTSQIDITSLADNIEGIWFDKTTGLYYTYSTIKGAASNDNNRVVVCFDSNGKRAKPDFFPTFAGQAGMITGREDRLLLKPANKPFWKEYSKNDWSLLRTAAAEPDEGICADELTGDVWIGSAKIIRKYDYTSLQVKDVFANPAKAIEGMAFDRADGTVWLNADRYLHGGANNGNTLYHYDFDRTYKKFVRFPEMIPWSAGTLSGGLVVKNDTLYGTGTWESPILDFENYTDFSKNDPSAIHDGNILTYQYRGSNTSPFFAVNLEMPVKYYSAWGLATPSLYSNTPSAYRYQQMKVTVACIPPVLSANVTNVSCNGGCNGMIDLSVSGSSVPFTYTWSNGSVTEDIGNLAAGTYTVKVSASDGCSATADYTVTEPAPLPATATVLACDSYTWPVTGETYLSSGIYNAVVGCRSYILALTVLPATSSEETASAFDSYTWHKNTYTVSGDYKNTTNCNTATLHLTIFRHTKFKIFPNPALSSIVNASFRSEKNGVKYEITIREINGKTLVHKTGFTVAGENIVPLNIDGLANALYLVTVVSGDNIQVQKFKKIK